MRSSGMPIHSPGRVRDSIWSPARESTSRRDHSRRGKDYPPCRAPVQISLALTADYVAAAMAPLGAARKSDLIMSTAPVGGQAIEMLVDAIRPRADRPH
jgi:hypothetical protein